MTVPWLQAGPGRFQARAWPEEDALAPATPRQAESGRRRSRRSHQQSANGDAPPAAESGASRAPSWRAQVQELEHTVGAELKSALSSAMLLLADQVCAKKWLGADLATTPVHFV